MNYGAELQAYSTIKALKMLGHDVQMIDIRLSDSRDTNIKSIIAEFISSLGPARKKFEKFWRDNIPVTRRYHSIEQLRESPPEADVYLVGSDQVWNPDITGRFALLYFLNFGEEKIIRGSYASSFGTEMWYSDHLSQEVRPLLDRFSFLGCRELTGVEIMKNTFNLNSTLTLDPTLLFDTYPELTGNISQKETLLFYPLSNDQELKKYAEGVADQLGLKLVNNKETHKLMNRFLWDRVSVEEWVRNIAEAQFVITRSFHGLVFSILYRKPFAIIANNNNRSTRVLNLLSQLGLSDRYYDNFDSCDKAKPWDNPIDYDSVHARLSALRENSLKFLTDCLK